MLSDTIQAALKECVTSLPATLQEICANIPVVGDFLGPIFGLMNICLEPLTSIFGGALLF
jgi:hypothetical protein